MSEAFALPKLKARRRRKKPDPDKVLYVLWMALGLVGLAVAVSKYARGERDFDVFLMLAMNAFVFACMFWSYKHRIPPWRPRLSGWIMAYGWAVTIQWALS